MRNYNNIRGILRAKQGSQIPKFNWGFKVDYNNKKSDNPSNINHGSLASNNLTINNPNPYMNNDGLSRSANLDYQNATDEELKRATTDPKTGGSVIEAKKLITQEKFIQDIPKNSLIVGNVFDMIGQASNNTYNNKGTNNMFAAGDMIANGLSTINPVLGMYGKGVMAVLKGVNSLGGSNTQEFSADLSTLAQVGGSYGGAVSDINNAASKAGKKYGLFSSGSRRKANRQIDQARLLQNIMTDIADTASDLRAMVNDLNYINHQFALNGGYDLRYMRAAKSGMKLQDKIDLIKCRKFNQVINVDSKLIEEFKEGGKIETLDWEPIITEYVEEFKEGGNLPEIEDFWEPIIVEFIEEFKEGGKTKEELETPEIEETNQKNLIPEGALHKNKHHMEHTEGLTLKGIPVIDNEGELLAEIEHSEIIFTLEVTKKLEELYKDGSDEAAIEAGKLLVKEILFNTDDRMNLISKCLEGGKL